MPITQAAAGARAAHGLPVAFALEHDRPSASCAATRATPAAVVDDGRGRTEHQDTRLRVRGWCAWERVRHPTTRKDARVSTARWSNAGDAHAAPGVLRRGEERV